MGSGGSPPEEVKPVSLQLSEKDFSRLAWLKARLSYRRKRVYSFEEAISLLLDREEKIKQIRLWLYTILIFLAITAILFIPFGITIKTFFLVAGIGAIFGLISFYLLTPRAFPGTSPIPDEKINNIIQKLAHKAGFSKPPRLLLLNTPEINAMAVGGATPSVILTFGLVAAHRNGALTDEELAAIIGHEIGHLKHHDGLRCSLASAWISIFSTGGEIITSIGTNLVLKDQSAHPSVFTVCASIFLVGFGLFFKGLSKIASVLYFHLSRKQEYDADDIGAQLTHPNHMKSALAKIEDLNKSLVEKEMQQLPFPDLWQVKPKKLSIIDRLWTTHPPTEERIARQAELASFI
jgi:heat shock protein HtpX